MSKRRRREPAITMLVGRDTRVHGDLEFNGACVVDGYVVGNVRSVGDDEAALNISENGCVEGAIDVPNVLLKGTVKGDVRAVQRIELGSSARVYGDVEYGLIEMAGGAEVNGKLLHSSELAGTADATGAEPGEPEERLAEDGNVNMIGEST